MVKVNLGGLMEVAMKESFKIIKLKVLEFINGLMVVLMRVTGRVIKCMVKVYIHGPMVKNMKGNF
jgi:hypothetical protein